MRKRSAGISIGTTLLAVALVATLAFTLASLSITHLSLVARTSQSEQARNLARSVVNQAIAGVLEDKSFGTAGEELVVSLAGTEGEGRLTFSEDTAADWGVPRSVNNIAGTGSVEGGQGQVVPVAAVHLVGVGESGTTRHRVEAILIIPPFPFAIASAGPIRSRGSVLIAGLPQGEEPTLDLEKLEPADLLSNFPGAGAIRLGANTTVSGDIQAVGEVVLDDGNIRVLGEVRSQAAPEQIPDLDSEEFDPAAQGLAFDPLSLQSSGTTAGDEPSAVLSGAVRSDGDARFPHGLELDGATLFVDGDLVVENGLRGSGVVVVTGQTRISGGTNLSTENQVALLSEGDITLSGHGPLSSRFHGLLYTDGGLRAEQISLVGTLVARGDPGVDLRDTYVYVEKVPVQEEEAGGLPVDQWFFPLWEPKGAVAAEMPGTVPFLHVVSDGEKLTATCEFTNSGGTFTNPRDFETFLNVLLNPYNGAAMLQAGEIDLTTQEVLDTVYGPGFGGGESGITYVDGTGLVTMTPSQFLKREEGIRLALWREE